MFSTHEQHRKIIEPYTCALLDIEKRVHPFKTKPQKYPQTIKLIFPGDEGDRAYRNHSPMAQAFELRIPSILEAMDNLLNHHENYLRMLTQDHLSIGEYIRMIAEDAMKVRVLGGLTCVLFCDVLETCSSACDEALLAARRAPSAQLLSPDMFAFFALETAELRSDLRRLTTAILSAEAAFGNRSVHSALCPRCQTVNEKECDISELN